MLRKQLLTLALVFVLVLASGTSFAQSRFLSDGQSGGEVAGHFGSGEDYSSLGIGFGYSFGSKFDLGLGLSRTSFDDEVIGEDGSATEFSPFAAFTLVRPSQTSIVGAELSAAYSFGSYSSDALDFMDWDMTGDALSIGANLYLKLDSSPTLTVYPIVGVDYVTVGAKIEDSFGNSEEDTIDDVAFSAGVNLVFNKKIILTPSFRTFDGNSSFGLSLGLLIPKSN